MSSLNKDARRTFGVLPVMQYESGTCDFLCFSKRLQNEVPAKVVVPFLLNEGVAGRFLALSNREKNSRFLSACAMLQTSSEP